MCGYVLGLAKRSRPVAWLSAPRRLGSCLSGRQFRGGGREIDCIADRRKGKMASGEGAGPEQQGGQRRGRKMEALMEASSPGRLGTAVQRQDGLERAPCWCRASGRVDCGSDGAGGSYGMALICPGRKRRLAASAAGWHAGRAMLTARSDEGKANAAEVGCWWSAALHCLEQSRF